MKVIKKEWKLILGSTWIFGLFAHAYRLFNFLPTGDTMFCFIGSGATDKHGRWFLDYASWLGTKYELPWINGILSFAYIAVATIMVIELLEIKNKYSIILTAALLVTFPTITSNFAYMFTADGYAFAFMLSVLGVYLAEKYKYGFIAGMIFICLAMSTYQAYLSVSLVLVLIVCIKRVLLDEMTVDKAFFREYKHVFALLGGAVLNKVLTDMILKYKGTSLSSYQGINDVHMLTIEDNLKAVKASWDSFGYYFMIGPWADVSIYSLLNQLVFWLLLGFTVYFVVKKKVYKRPVALVCIVIAYFCMPLLAYIIRFVSVKVVYHALMIMALCFVYIYVLLLMEHMKEENKIERMLKVITGLALCGICYINIINANYSYYQMNLSYEKSNAIASDVLSRVESIEEFDGTQEIAIIGVYSGETERIVPETPEIAGVSSNTLLGSQDHFLAMWEYCMARKYTGAQSEVIADIQQMEEFKNMNSYPYAGCAKYIDGVVVVKLSE